MSEKNRKDAPVPILGDHSLWPEETLELLKVHFKNNKVSTDEFEKLNNPLLHALKEVTNSLPVVCTKCHDLVRMTKNGRNKETYQFNCVPGEHGRSATQILSSLPDDWVSELTNDLDSRYRAELLKWAEKGELWAEHWQIQSSTGRNAMKRLAVELSPIKSDSLKIRAVNNAFEEENKTLKKQIDILTDENKELRKEISEMKSMLKSITVELGNYKRFLLEPKDADKDKDKDKAIVTEDITVEKPSFATVTALHRPTVKLNARRPLQIITGERITRTNTTKPAYSPLKIIHFKGCRRAGPSEYRRMFREIGIDTRTVRDVLFLTDEILQLTVYEAAIDTITEKLKAVSESVERIYDFNPLSGASYCDDGSISDEVAKNCYMAMMKISADRMEQMAETIKPLKRTASFLKKIVETGDLNYQTPERKPRAFLLGHFFEISKPVSTDAEMSNSSMDNVPKPDTNESEMKNLGSNDQPETVTSDSEMNHINPNDQQ